MSSTLESEKLTLEARVAKLEAALVTKTEGEAAIAWGKVEELRREANELVLRLRVTNTQLYHAEQDYQSLIAEPDSDPNQPIPY